MEAPTPLVHIISVKEKMKRHIKAPKSNRKSMPSGRGSPRWMISRSDWERGVKKTCNIIASVAFLLESGAIFRSSGLDA